MSFTYHGIELPAHAREAIDNYVTYGTCGHFFRAVFENDLFNACARADDDNLPALPAIVGYVYNEIPGNAWGSPEKVDAWQAARLTERQTA